MPDKPVIPQRSPRIVEVGPGTVYWCQCGRSKTQPFCDGSRTETEFSPMEVHTKEKKRVAFCGCMQTKNPLFCDGSRSRIKRCGAGSESA
jgi:CDGSH-type Zn-finger protein